MNCISKCFTTALALGLVALSLLHSAADPLNNTLVRSETNLFAMDVFNAVVPKQSDKNIIISPLYIRNMVAMLYAGAGYSTANQLRRLLRFNASNSKRENEEELQQIFRYRIPATSVKNTFYISNPIHIAPQYYNTVLKSLNIDVKKINFERPPLMELNNTGLVKHKDDITHIAAMIENKIDFESKWQYEFPDNKRRIFTRKGGRERMVTMMHLKGKFRYVKSLTLNARFLELLFAKKGLAMLLMLPDERDGLQDVELNLKHENMDKLFHYMHYGEMDVYLPKFKIDFEVDLEPVLIELGVSSVFGPNADFSDLFLNALPAQTSTLFKLKHSASIVVNNEGVKQSTRGITNIKPYSLDGNRVMEFNHPFAYFIHDRKKIIFIGHVAMV